jgi:hypothetical protein
MELRGLLARRRARGRGGTDGADPVDETSARVAAGDPRPQVRADAFDVGTRTQLGSWVFSGAWACASLRHMSLRKLLPLAVLVTALLPATALAAPTVTVTGDDGNPLPLNAVEPVGIRNMEVEADVSVPTTDSRFFTSQVLDAAGTPASSLSPCRETRFGPTWKNFTDYRGNGTYSVVLRYYNTAGDSDCNGAVSERRFQFTINAGTAVATPPGRALTRAPNAFLTNTYQLGVGLNPGASTYEVRYARGGVVGPDGAISGPSGETFVDKTTGLADFRFDKPGSWVIVARAKSGDFFTPWSAPVTVSAIAPFDLERTSFPDARGPSYKVRGQIRERVARGKVTISIARGKKTGKFHKIGKAKINSKGRFAKRFTVRRTGTYRLRYTYKGSSLVAGGRVTEQVRIRKRVFFG